MMTSFTRIVIVLSFLRNALGTQQSPPNQILVGLGLVPDLIYHESCNFLGQHPGIPALPGRADYQEQAFERAQEPMKEFMLKQTEKKAWICFCPYPKHSRRIYPRDRKGYMKLGLTTLVPSFILSELNKAFTMGFLIFIPFLIIDLVVSSTLMSMGMVMLPPP